MQKHDRKKHIAQLSKIIGRRLNRLRKLNGLTHQQFTAPLGVSAQNSVRWCRGQALPQLDTLVRICQVHRAEAAWLLRPAGKAGL